MSQRENSRQIRYKFARRYKQLKYDVLFCEILTSDKFAIQPVELVIHIFRPRVTQCVFIVQCLENRKLHVNAYNLNNTYNTIYIYAHVLKKFFSFRHACLVCKQIVIFEMRIKTKKNRISVVTSILFDFTPTMCVTSCISKCFFVSYRVSYTAYV